MRLNIRGNVWRLIWVRAFEDDRIGEADDEERAIRILRDLPEREKLRVVLHELLHAEWRPRRSDGPAT